MVNGSAHVGACAGLFTPREASRRVGRDVCAVHSDAHMLVQAGVLRKDEEGRIELPYTAVHMDFMSNAAQQVSPARGAMEIDLPSSRLLQGDMLIACSRPRPDTHVQHATRSIDPSAGCCPVILLLLCGIMGQVPETHRPEAQNGGGSGIQAGGFMRC